jgi:GntR family transcriptional regulator
VSAVAPGGRRRTPRQVPAALNRALPAPLYHQIFTALRDRVLDGTYPIGSALPTERDISEQFGVSRITGKRALNEMAARGLVVRERGRGTYVAGFGSRTPLLASVEGLLENNLTMGLQTEVALLQFDYSPADAVVAEALRIERGQVVQAAVRVRKVDGVPFSHISTWVPEDIGRAYSSEDLSTQPLLLLLERSGIAIARAEQSITAENASASVAQALRLEANTALLRIERIVYGYDERPVEYIRALYCPGRYEYRMALQRAGSDNTRLWTNPVS